MKQLLCAFLLVLLCVALGEPAWAEVDPNNGCTVTQVKPNQIMWSDCPPLLPAKPSLKVLMAGEEAPNPLVCLATMEQAMRAMEPWIRLGKTLEYKEVDKYVAAWDQWKAAKGECWRKP
jgi:hypothetical protein